MKEILKNLMNLDKPVLFHGIRKMNGSYEGSYEDDGAAQREFGKERGRCAE